MRSYKGDCRLKHNHFENNFFLKVHNANVAVMATRLKSFLITFYLVSISLRYCKRITFSYVFYFGFGRKAASAKSRTLLNALHTCKRIGTLF